MASLENITSHSSFHRLALTLALALPFAHACNAQAPAAAGAAIENAATALGMVRGVGRRMDSINTLEFSGRGILDVPQADGEWTSFELTDATVGISYSIPAMRMDTTLDENSRPAIVEMMIDHPVLGQTLLEAEYTDYVDWPILDVFFPSRIVHRLGGETTMDITITEFYQNPYVVFPTPEQLSRSAQA